MHTRQENRRKAPELCSDAKDAVATNVPLCVDLDGTLIAGDTLIISLIQIIRKKPWHLPGIAFSLVFGRARFKKRVADCLVPHPRDLPYRPEVLQLLRDFSTRGRTLILATGADERIAAAVASELGLFHGVIGSDGRSNLKGENKVHAIRRYLHGKAFDYMGDSTADLPVLSAARAAYLVRPSKRLLQAAKASCNLKAIIA